MNKLAVLLFGSLITLAIANTAFGDLGVTIEGTYSEATNPYSYDAATGGFGRTTGYGIGANWDITDYLPGFLPRVRMLRLAVRADVNSYRWSESEGYAEWSYQRRPVFLGLRPSVRLISSLSAFVEIGALRSVDKSKFSYTGPLYGIYSSGSSAGSSENRTGSAGSIGLEYVIANVVTISAKARYHDVHNEFTTYGAAVGVRF